MGGWSSLSPSGCPLRRSGNVIGDGPSQAGNARKWPHFQVNFVQETLSVGPTPSNELCFRSEPLVGGFGARKTIINPRIGPKRVERVKGEND